MKDIMLDGLRDESQQGTQVDLPQIITLNNADRDSFLKALASEEGPNEALIQAAHKFNERYSRQWEQA